MTLDEIVAEGERLERELAAENARKNPDWHLVSDLSARLFHIYKHHGPRLLAVAKAAVEMREGVVETERYKTVTHRLRAARVAFDAAASGEAEEKRWARS